MWEAIKMFVYFFPERCDKFALELNVQSQLPAVAPCTRVLENHMSGP